MQTSTNDVIGVGKGRLSDDVGAAQIPTELGRGLHFHCVGNCFPSRLSVLIVTTELEIIDVNGQHHTKGFVGENNWPSWDCSKASEKQG